MLKMRPSKVGIIYASLFVFISAVIFIFAGFSGDVSSSQSGFVVNVLNSILRFFGVVLNEGELAGFALFVRKFFGHFLIFLIDGVFAYLALYKLFSFKKNLIILLFGVLLMFLVAGISEFIQFFAGGRSANWIDVAIDLGGATIGLIIAFAFTIKTNEKAGNEPASI
ncbi:MAG: VanZ family protein [Bacilli bacterium]|nr:VanZ family protein [Bacilli bacterium]MDD4005887.1 VanZ family protein [Bacilli bacterium]